jgi:hypothetical protein
MNPMQSTELCLQGETMGLNVANKVIVVEVGGNEIISTVDFVVNDDISDITLIYNRPLDYSQSNLLYVLPTHANDTSD